MSAREPLVLRGRVVTPEAVLEDGVVVVAGPQIAWVGPVAAVPDPWAAAARATRPTADTLLPGLVDLHNHGGGGASLPDAGDLETVRRAVAEHLAYGTTRQVASLVTASGALLVERARTLAAAVAADEIAGIHVEGPFLSVARCGAHDPEAIVPGDAQLVHDLATVASGGIVSMTLAPEVAGAEEVIDALVAVGSVPSFGHTDAGADQTRAAIARARAALAAPGARSARPTATHLFNAMRPPHHRDPGPVAECLAAAARGELVVELVGDGQHLADATVRTVFELVGPHGVALVTDATAGAGMPDGDYVLGGREVEVRDGVARLREDGALAGGTAHLIDVVRRVVASGVALPDAVRAAATTPAGVLGRDDVGALEAGRLADVVVTDRDLVVRRVLRAGERVVG